MHELKRYIINLNEFIFKNISRFIILNKTYKLALGTL